MYTKFVSYFLKKALFFQFHFALGLSYSVLIQDGEA